MSDDRYRKLKTRVWSDERFRRLSALQPSGQSMFLVLVAGPQTGPIPGLYRAGLGSIADEMGWSARATARAFREVEAEGMVRADLNARLVYLPKALKHNPPASPNVIRSWSAELATLPECDLKRQAIAEMRVQLYAMGSEAFGKAFDEVCAKALGPSSAKPSANPSPNQEQEQFLFSEPDGSSTPVMELGAPTHTNPAVSTDSDTPGARVWASYSAAYEARYGAPPLRNAKVNSILAQFAKTVPADEAPAVAAWFVRSSESFYVRRKHPVDVMLADAAKLRTEWMTGRFGSDTEARAADRTQARGNVFSELVRAARDAA